MIYRHINNELGGQFVMIMNESNIDWEQHNRDHLINIIWNASDSPVDMRIDDVVITLPANSLITTTYFYKVAVPEHQESLIVFSFNKPYYCIYDHDHEVSCNGIIFFGAQQLSPINIDEKFQKKLHLLLQVFVDEFEYKDNIQGDMLVVLLKRLIIICTRLARENDVYDHVIPNSIETIRQFNFLVDMHFREKKSVREYADLLFKAPKTLANMFAKAGGRSPIQIIHERIVLEAKRLLTYSDKNISEITRELGYSDPTTFYKLFRKHTGDSPQNYRQNSALVTRGSL